jgi:hypothetical protein
MVISVLHYFYVETFLEGRQKGGNQPQTLSKLSGFDAKIFVGDFDLVLREILQITSHHDFS